LLPGSTQLPHRALSGFGHRLRPEQALLKNSPNAPETIYARGSGAERFACSRANGRRLGLTRRRMVGPSSVVFSASIDLGSAGAGDGAEQVSALHWPLFEVASDVRFRSDVQISRRSDGPKNPCGGSTGPVVPRRQRRPHEPPHDPRAAVESIKATFATCSTPDGASPCFGRGSRADTLRPKSGGARQRRPGAPQVA